MLEPCSSVRVKQGMEGQVSDKGTTTEIFFLPFSIVLCVDGMECVAFSVYFVESAIIKQEHVCCKDCYHCGGLSS